MQKINYPQKSPLLTSLKWFMMLTGLHLFLHHFRLLYPADVSSVFAATTHSTGAFAKLRKVTISFVTSFSTQNKSAPTGRIFIKLRHLRIFRKCVQKIQVTPKSYKNNGHFTYIIISCWIFLKITNASDKICRENQSNFKSSKILFRKSCRLWDNVEKRECAWEAVKYGVCAVHAG